MASIILDISPPDAIFISSLLSSPIFVEIANSILSFPFILKLASFSIFMLKHAFGISKSFNSLFIFSLNIIPYFSRFSFIKLHKLFILLSISFCSILSFLFISSTFSICSISSASLLLYSNISSILLPYFLFRLSIVSNLVSTSSLCCSSKSTSSQYFSISLDISCIS